MFVFSCNCFPNQKALSQFFSNYHTTSNISIEHIIRVIKQYSEFGYESIVEYWSALYGIQSNNDKEFFNSIIKCLGLSANNINCKRFLLNLMQIILEHSKAELDNGSYEFYQDLGMRALTNFAKKPKATNKNVLHANTNNDNSRKKRIFQTCGVIILTAAVISTAFMLYKLTEQIVVQQKQLEILSETFIAITESTTEQQNEILHQSIENKDEELERISGELEEKTETIASKEEEILTLQLAITTKDATIAQLQR